VVSWGQLRASIEQNKKGLAIAGAAGVAGLALLNKNRGGSAPAGEGAPASGGRYGLSSTPLPASGGVYDSSSSDVYNAIQPQLEELGRLMTEAKSPIPVPAPPKWGPGLYQIADNTTVYAVDEAGNRDWLNVGEFAAMQDRLGRRPDTTLVPVDSSFWNDTNLVGEDSGKAAGYWFGGGKKRTTTTP
jgi:hypothetical protein